MSAADMEMLLMEETDFWVQRFRDAENAVLALRHGLRCDNPTLPPIHDGTAWGAIESKWDQDRKADW